MQAFTGAALHDLPQYWSPFCMYPHLYIAPIMHFTHFYFYGFHIFCTKIDLSVNSILRDLSFLKCISILFVRQRERGIVRSSIHWLTLQCSWLQAEPSQSWEHRVWVSGAGVKDPSAWAIAYAVPGGALAGNWVQSTIPWLTKHSQWNVGITDVQCLPLSRRPFKVSLSSVFPVPDSCQLNCTK